MLEYKIVNRQKVYINSDMELRVVSEDPVEQNPIISFVDSLPIDIVINGLLEKDINKKQWFLEQLLPIMKVDPEHLKKALSAQNLPVWKEGIQP